MVKKLLCFAILTAFLWSAFIPPACAQVSAPKNLLLFGDSISTGYGLSNPGKSFGSLLKKALAAPNYKDLAVNGATSANVLAAAKNHKEEIRTADTILLTAGGNDVLNVFFSSIRSSLGLPENAPARQILENLIGKKNALDQIEAKLKDTQTQAKLKAAEMGFAQNLPAIVSEIHTTNPRAKLYIQTVYNPFSDESDLFPFAGLADEILSHINTEIKNDAAGKYTVIDSYSAFRNQALTLTNIAGFDIHPSEAGHAVIFRLAYEAVTGKQYAVTSSGSRAPGSGAPSAAGNSSSLSSGSALGSSSGKLEAGAEIAGDAALLLLAGVGVWKRKKR
ncbi:MAG TPA: SGNH/GDSL hydrolase family protein [Clostridia bacterium]|nr:SGNH/GDSL hydrolase family protein [Clostridia bacterium]